MRPEAKQWGNRGNQGNQVNQRAYRGNQMPSSGVTGVTRLTSVHIRVTRRTDFCVAFKIQENPVSNEENTLPFLPP